MSRRNETGPVPDRTAVETSDGYWETADEYGMRVLRIVGVASYKYRCETCGGTIPPAVEPNSCTSMEVKKCPGCGHYVSECCGAYIINDECGNENGECEVCEYCGSEKCSKCGEHLHCGGCV